MSSPPPPRELDPDARRRARAALVVGAVLAALVLREGWREATKVRERPASIDARFGPFVIPARGERRIGMLADLGADAMARVRRFELEYALAPAVLVAGTTGVRLVAAFAESEAELERVAAENRLRIVARTGDGCALLEKLRP